jgi:quinol monooxygenase YgiN
MGQVVIVAYRPKVGKSKELLAAVEKHVRVLREENLATDRAATVLKAKDGTIVEVFEWRSAEAIQAAHTNAAVLAMWDDFWAASDVVPLSDLAEAKALFAEFEAVAF